MGMLYSQIPPKQGFIEAPRGTFPGYLSSAQDAFKEPKSSLAMAPHTMLSALGYIPTEFSRTRWSSDVSVQGIPLFTRL